MKALYVVVAAFFVSGFAFADDTALSVDPLPTDALLDSDQSFLIYLETSEVPAEQVRHYLGGLDECLRLLENGDGVGARRLLASLAHDCASIDRGLCDELGRRMDATGIILEEKQSVAKANGELQSSVDKPELSPDEIADAVRKQNQDQRNKSSSSDSPDNSTSTRLTENYLKDVQAREEAAANDTNYRQLLDHCRADFIAYIQALPDAGHYRLFPVAAAACRYLFPGIDDSPEIKNALAVGQDQVGELEHTIAVARDEGAHGRLVSAAGQLLSAYRLSRDDPRLLEVTLTLKKPILALILQQEKLRGAIQAKDPAACDTLVSEMAREAVDFDPKPVQEFAATLREKSQLLVSQAKSEIEQGNSAGGMRDLQEAVETWPGNPALQGGAIELVLKQDAKSVALKKFDAYWAQADYLSLVGQSQEFARWLESDPSRKEALKIAREKVNSANEAIRQAGALQAAGQAAAAWETIACAASTWHGNQRLNALKLAFASGAPDFVHAIGQAQEAENRNDLGLSLSWYAVARSYDAQSCLAREGMDRTAKRLLR